MVSGGSGEGGVKSKISANEKMDSAAEPCPLEAINLLSQIKKEIEEK